jgi:hypothetical protein
MQPKLSEAGLFEDLTDGQETFIAAYKASESRRLYDFKVAKS